MLGDNAAASRATVLQHGEAGTSPSAIVLNVQRMSTEDGPGLRTTVFFKGCSLACGWCHNPEALEVKLQLVWHRSRCIGARQCVAVCRQEALARDGRAIDIDRARCTVCGDCVEHCPSAALEMLGRRWRLDDLVAEVAKDRSYFDTYGGGVTVSGGEPGLQAPFVGPFLQRCRELGMHTAVDTCGMCSVSALDALARNADLVLYDLKEIDSAKHERFTGRGNERIVTRLRDLAERMRATGAPAELWIRTPLIPGATLTDENIEGIGRLIAEDLADVVTRWELCAFNNLAGDKYERLGMTWAFDGTDLLTIAELQHAESVARSSGVAPDIVSVTGRALGECDAGANAGPDA